MTPDERRMLAADIALRVRLFSWNPLPQPMVDMSAPYAWQQLVALPAARTSSQVLLRLNWTPAPARLTAEFQAPNGERMAAFLWTPERIES